VRLIRFESADGAVHAGRLVGDQTAQLLEADLGGELQFGDTTVKVARLLAPVNPPNIFAIGRNYRAHVEETGAPMPDSPLVFLKATTSLIGPGDAIELPASAPDAVDFEAELAIVIGRSARTIAPADALSHVLGYTCANDVSARDCQRDDNQWSRAKGFDTFCPLGPWIVTPDELDADDCVIRSRLNGKIMQESNTSHMMRGCRELISYLSHQFTLRPGTVILTGTPEGVGFARTPPIFLAPGDRIEIEIEGIGTLGNMVR
jgi:2-keto-4-pentenoate hydratase/2-oxohepta-3-ene-1,7-dioic acid hydratase in catechol pathway